MTRLAAKPGQRDAVVELLVQGLANRPGCLSYIVGLDPTDLNGLWVNEVWVSADAHKAAMEPAAVKALSVRLWDMLAAMHDPIVTQPIGGRGLG
ncbi:MAG: antibiotic biosynthesis monooxygenase [Brevundimonas sp.]|nr:MAG: antibiotic biosynthesis monooxygenase [Brevundimonas sp.]